MTDAAFAPSSGPLATRSPPLAIRYLLLRRRLSGDGWILSVSRAPDTVLEDVVLHSRIHMAQLLEEFTEAECCSRDILNLVLYMNTDKHTFFTAKILWKESAADEETLNKCRKIRFDIT